MLFRRMRETAKLSSIRFLCAPKQGNNHNLLFTKSSSLLHTSNKSTLTRADLHYAFGCITNTHDALTLFHYMLQMKPTPSVIDYNNLLHSVVKLKDDSHVVKMEHYTQVIIMFKKMRRLRCPVNEYTMNIVVNCYAHLKEVYLSIVVIGVFVKRGYSPDNFTFTCLIKGLFIRGKVAEAVGLFKKLITHKLGVVNEATFLCVLDGLSKSGYVADAVELLQIAERNNWNVNVRGYTTVVDGLCKGGKLKDGMALVLRMADIGVHPDVVTYSCLMHGLSMNGKLELACSIFNDLPSKGICPDVISYTVIIQGFCLEGRLREAKELLEKMELAGCPPNNFTYNIVIQGCLHRLSSADSINLIKQIVGVDFQLCASTFFLLLRKIHGLHDDDVIYHLIRKLTSSGAIQEMRDRNDEFMISSLKDKLDSSDSRCSVS